MGTRISPEPEPGSNEAFATSTGHHVSSAGWLDLHFESHRSAYESILRMVGIQPGWHVLDAGCGGGNFLPWLAEQVGADGRITAVDVEGPNVAAVEERLTGWNLECPVTVREASIFDLPFDDHSLDGVWCANVLMYFPHEEVKRALHEFRRVVRPGGIVAVKDPDARLITTHPGHPATLWHLFESWQNAPEWNSAKGMLSSSWRLAALLGRAGFDDVRQHVMPIERRAPLSDTQRRFLLEAIPFWATFVEGVDLPGEERTFWQQWRSPETATSALDHPDFYWREGQTLAVGLAPVL